MAWRHRGNHGYRKRKYYRQQDDSPLDMLFESLFELIVFLVKRAYRSIRSGEARNMFVLKNSSMPTSAAPIPTSMQSDQEEGRYRLNKSLVSDAEKEFLKTLEQAVEGKYRIVPQVPLSGIVSPKDSNYHYTNYRDFNKISAKKIDFVLYDTDNWTPRLAIELDDRSHLRWDRMQRDAFVNELMEGVGLAILHVRTSDGYNLVELKEEISEKIKI